MIKYKWGAGILSIVLVTSILAFPSVTEANIEKGGAKSTRLVSDVEHLKKQMKEQQQWLKNNGMPKNNQKKSVQEAVFKGKLDWYQNHTYHFVVEKEGMVEINEKKSSGKVTYVLMNNETFEEVKNGDKVPAGGYFLAVSYDNSLPSTERDQAYEVKIKGITMNSVDNSVPELHTNTPTMHETRLTTEAKNFQLKGSVKGADRVDITVNGTIYGLKGFTYSEVLPLRPGNNSYEVTAREITGNMAFEIFQVVKPHLERTAVSNPVSMSVQLSKKQYPSGAESILITNSRVGAESLTANAISSIHNAPILLTDGNQLSTLVMAEIKRLGPSKAIILGGDKVISKEVEAQLKKMNVKVDRQTQSIAQVAEKLIKASEMDSVTIVEATDFASAMYMSAGSGYRSPILLVEKDRVPDETKSVLQKYSQIKNLLVVGPQGQISEAVKKQLGSYGKVTEVTGKDRFEVGVNVSRHLSKEYGADVTDFFIVKDQDYVSALLGARFSLPILFTPTHSLNESVSAYFTENKPHVLRLIGGKGLISTEVERQLKELLN